MVSIYPEFNLSGLDSGSLTKYGITPARPQETYARSGRAILPDFLAKYLEPYPKLKAFIEKVMKDNIGMLASVVAWTLLTSVVPVVVGLLAITALVLRDPHTQAQVVDHVHTALQGTLTQKEIQDLVTASIRNNGLLGIIGVVGILWGGSNVGGSISTVFQPIFEVGGRNFFKEKLIDIVMIFVFIALMIVIVVATTAGAFVNQLASGFPLPGAMTFLIGTIISLLAAFLLFAAIYVVFPNTEPRFKLDSIWPGAAIAAVLFEALTYIFPLYRAVSHFQRYGAIIGAILLLTAWIYFFSLILMFGAEFVAVDALKKARRRGEPLGPAEDGTVPQHASVRRDSAAS